MKIFSVILSLYILLLTAVPCCIGEDCSEAITTEQSAHHNEKHECSNCSPFMNCGNCVGFTFDAFEPLLIKNTTFLIKEATLFFTTDSDFLFNFSSKIWQPPKLM